MGLADHLSRGFSSRGHRARRTAIQTDLRQLCRSTLSAAGPKEKAAKTRSRGSTFFRARFSGAGFWYGGVWH